MYISLATADGLIAAENENEGWSTLSAVMRTAYITKATNRIEIIPFIDDAGKARPRYSINPVSSPAIPNALKLATAYLSVWYARNPHISQVSSKGFDDEVEGIDILSDIPVNVRSALWPYIDDTIKGGVGAKEITRAIYGGELVYEDFENPGSAIPFGSPASPGSSRISFLPTKENIYAAVRAIFHPADQLAVAADDANSELDVATAAGGNVPTGTPFEATKENIYIAVKAILHPGTQTSVSADDDNSELDILTGTSVNPPFSATQQNIFDAVKVIFHPHNQDAVSANDTDREINISVPPFAPTKANIYAAVKAILHPGTQTSVSADDDNSELDIATGGRVAAATFVPTQDNMYATVKAILHPVDQVAVAADDVAKEIDIATAAGAVFTATQQNIYDAVKAIFHHETQSGFIFADDENKELDLYHSSPGPFGTRGIAKELDYTYGGVKTCIPGITKGLPVEEQGLVYGYGDIQTYISLESGKFYTRTEVDNGVRVVTYNETRNSVGRLTGGYTAGWAANAKAPPSSKKKTIAVEVAIATATTEIDLNALPDELVHCVAIGGTLEAPIVPTFVNGPPGLTAGLASAVAEISGLSDTSLVHSGITVNGLRWSARKVDLILPVVYYGRLYNDSGHLTGDTFVIFGEKVYEMVLRPQTRPTKRPAVWKEVQYNRFSIEPIPIDSSSFTGNPIVHSIKDVLERLNIRPLTVDLLNSVGYLASGQRAISVSQRNIGAVGFIELVSDKAAYSSSVARYNTTQRLLSYTAITTLPVPLGSSSVLKADALAISKARKIVTESWTYAFNFGLRFAKSSGDYGSKPFTFQVPAVPPVPLVLPANVPKVYIRSRLVVLPFDAAKVYVHGELASSGGTLYRFIRFLNGGPNTPSAGSAAQIPSWESLGGYASSQAPGSWLTPANLIISGDQDLTNFVIVLRSARIPRLGAAEKAIIDVEFARSSNHAFDIQLEAVGFADADNVNVSATQVIYTSALLAAASVAFKYELPVGRLNAIPGVEFEIVVKVKTGTMASFVSSGSITVTVI